MDDRSATEQQLADGPWCDVELRGISWVEEGRDLALTLRFPPSASAERRDKLMRAHWVTELTATLSLAKKTGGYPLTWDVEFEQSLTDEWLVRFDFGGVGELRFRCTSFELFPCP